MGREGLASSSRGFQFDFLFGRFNRTDPSADRVRQSAKLLDKSVGKRDRGSHPAIGWSEPFQPISGCIEERVRGREGFTGLRLRFVESVMHEQSGPGSFVVEGIEKVGDRAAGDAQTQLVRGDVPQRMCLIENGHIVIRKQRSPLGAQGQVTHIERVIDDQETGRPDPPRHLEKDNGTTRG